MTQPLWLVKYLQRRFMTSALSCACRIELKHQRSYQCYYPSQSPFISQTPHVFHLCFGISCWMTQPVSSLQCPEGSYRVHYCGEKGLLLINQGGSTRTQQSSSSINSTIYTRASQVVYMYLDTIYNCSSYDMSPIGPICCNCVSSLLPSLFLIHCLHQILFSLLFLS